MKTLKHFFFLFVISSLFAACDLDLSNPSSPVTTDSTCIRWNQYKNATTPNWQPMTESKYRLQKYIDSGTTSRDTALEIGKIYFGERLIFSSSYTLYSIRYTWYGGIKTEVSTVSIGNRVFDVIHWYPNVWDCSDRVRFNSRELLLFIDATTHQLYSVFWGYSSDRITTLKIISDGVVVRTYEHCWDYNGTELTFFHKINEPRSYTIPYPECN